jgi:hypothetical protein
VATLDPCHAAGHSGQTDGRTRILEQRWKHPAGEACIRYYLRTCVQYSHLVRNHRQDRMAARGRLVAVSEIVVQVGREGVETEKESTIAGFFW